MSTGRLSARDIRRLFDELAVELASRGARAELFLVGGAAIALCFDSRRATRDLDAAFAPTSEVRRAAEAVAEREGLDPLWLNRLYLLAMKLFSSRTEVDADDIALLYREVGFTTVEEGLDLVERSYPGRPIEPKVQFLLEEIVESFRG